MGDGEKNRLEIQVALSIGMCVADAVSSPKLRVMYVRCRMLNTRILTHGARRESSKLETPFVLCRFRL